MWEEEEEEGEEEEIRFAGFGVRRSDERRIGWKRGGGVVCFYPFTTSSSATQRKIKHQTDQLVKSHESKGLTLVQVAQFINCLIEARNEIQHKSDAIRRKFTITKALLLKANRSSFDGLRQQIYKIELEQKRLEEDAFAYNWLQQQVKLSPACKTVNSIFVRSSTWTLTRKFSYKALIVKLFKHNEHPVPSPSMCVPFFRNLKSI